MAKLFALEENELTGDIIELETAPEVGEVADVQVDLEADVNVIAEIKSGIEEGMGAADQLEQVESVVAATASVDGLDPVAAEAIKIAVEAICARIGANPKAVYSLYATENFKSASSRKANTKYALEGLGEFLKNLWEKIKAALSSLWEKIKAFWNKHVSSLNRTLKALESMKDRVTQVKGTQSYTPVDAPASLRSIFPTKGATLGVDEIMGFATTIQTATSNMSNFRLLDKMSQVATLAEVGKVATSALTATGVVVEFGTETQPLPGGQYFKWTYKLNKETDDGVDIITLEVDEDHGKFTEGRKETQLDVANKDKLKTLITDTIASTKALIKYRDKVEQRAKAVNNSFKAIDKEINALATPADIKSAKGSVRSFNLIMSKGPLMETKLLSVNLTHTKGVLAYTAACLKQFKS